MIPTACSVALPIPVEVPYSYAVPTALAARIVPGSRVVVSVRSTMMVGIVVEVSAGEIEGLKPVLLCPDAEPLMPQSLIELARWMAGYYFTPVGLVLRSMLPGSLWGKSRIVVHPGDVARAGGGSGVALLHALRARGGPMTASALAGKIGRPIWDTLQRLERTGAVVLETEPPKLGPAPGRERHVILTASLDTLLDRERVFGRAHKQRNAFEVIDSLGGDVVVSELREKHGVSSAVIGALVNRGIARFDEREQLRDPFAGLAGTAPPEPDDLQKAAISEIATAKPGSALSLFGVTGSGKTLVYLEAVRRDVEARRGVIVLVPEISLTPQTIARVRGVFGKDVAVLHSALSDGERADAWRALAAGKKRVAVGARSAVFAPVRDLAFIVVDEEHDSSYKNGESPRYNARDVAIRRARSEGAKVVLSSATPALETWVARERIGVVSLPRRVGDRPMPEVRLVDLTKEARVNTGGPLTWSETLDGEVESRLTGGDQVILLLNRRGFAHFLQCDGCGEVTGCPHCSIALTVHSAPRRLFCHYCGYSREVATICELCASEKHVSRGTGTQQLERWLGERFPAARLARMDADTTATRWSHHKILGDFGRGEIDVLFGTQMIAKGLDFPNVTLVGVVDADTGLNLPDFRAAERTFQLVAQVAGRSGRGEKGGEVVVQTRCPDHYALKAAALHDFEAFAAADLETRKSPAYPPHVALINVVVSGTSETGVSGAAGDLGRWVRDLVAAKFAGEVDVIGPAPAPLAKIKRRWRWHFVLRSADRAGLGRVGRYVSGKTQSVVGTSVRVIFDRDPVSLF